MENQEKKVVLTKTYTITVTHFDNGTFAMTRLNDGFQPLELIGLSEFIALEVREQILGRVKPDTITRQVVVDDDAPLENERKPYTPHSTNPNP